MNWFKTILSIMGTLVVCLSGFSYAYAYENYELCGRGEVIADWEKKAEQAHWQNKIFAGEDNKFNCVQRIIALHNARKMVLAVSEAINQKLNSNSLKQNALELKEQSLFDISSQHISAFYNKTLQLIFTNMIFTKHETLAGPEHLRTFYSQMLLFFQNNNRSKQKDAACRYKVGLKDFLSLIPVFSHSYQLDQTVIDYFSLFLYIWEDTAGAKCALTQLLFFEVPACLITSFSLIFNLNPNIKQNKVSRRDHGAHGGSVVDWDFMKSYEKRNYLYMPSPPAPLPGVEGRFCKGVCFV